MKSQPKTKNPQPVHLRIQENTPVYVHLIQHPEKGTQSSNEISKSGNVTGPSSNPTSPRKEPWIPPPAKTTKKEKSALLPSVKRAKPMLPTDIEQGDILLRFQTLSAPELQNVEIETTHDVGTLTNISAGTSQSFVNQVLNEEAQLEFEEQDLDQKKKSVSVISPTIYEEEITDLRKELDLIDKRCQLLFSSLQFVHSHDQVKSSLESKQDNMMQQAKELKKMASKVELQAQESAATATGLMDVLENLQKEEKDNCSRRSKLNYLYKEKEELLNKLLTAFETNNIVLRTIIENQQKNITPTMDDGKDKILKADILQETVEKLRTSLSEKTQEMSNLERDLYLYKEQVASFERTKISLEKIRAQMQRELHNKESQLERLRIHIQKLQDSAPEEKEIQQLTVALEETRDKARAEKEALKKAVRVQRLRAEQSEETIIQLKNSIEKNKLLVTQLVAERDQWKATLTEEMNKEMQEKVKNSTLESKILTMEEKLQHIESSHLDKLKELTSTLESKSSQLDLLAVENEKLKNLHLEHESVQSDLNDLKTQLQEAKEANSTFKKQLSEAGIQVSELTLKLEQQGEQLKFFQKMSAEVEAKSYGKTKQPYINEWTQTFATEVEMESVPCLKLRFQEKQEEVHRLETILQRFQEDTQKQIADLKKQFYKQENYLQSKISTLDHELAEKNAELTKVSLEKDEIEYKLRKKLEDLQDSLLQAQSGNKSLQKYVQFLKSSYASVFGESLKLSREALE